MIKIINPGSYSVKEAELGTGGIEAIAFRVVHGGKFYRPTFLTGEVKLQIEKFEHLAPLHNTKVLKYSSEFEKKYPGITQIAVFDTEFFHRLPEVTRYYPFSFKLQDKLGIRRFGFHGISHESMMRQTAVQLNKSVDKVNLITVHLGQGCSMTAIKQGKPVDTSMGFSPLSGLMMGTRPGDVDVGIVLHLLKLGERQRTINKLLNEESGWFGVSGEDDFRRVIEGAKNNRDCSLALDMFVTRVRKYLGAYYFLLQGDVDAVVFTGSIGEGSEEIRRMILDNLPLLSEVETLTVSSREAELIYKKAKLLLSPSAIAD